MYQIEYNYRTGNSFHTEDCIERLEFKCFKRIKEHYCWYNDNRKGIKRPDWLTTEYDFCLNIQMDNGAEIDFSAPWCILKHYMEQV